MSWILTSSWDWDGSGLSDLLWLALKRGWGSHDCGYKSVARGVEVFVEWSWNKLSQKVAGSESVVLSMCFRYRNFFVSLSHPAHAQIGLAQFWRTVSQRGCKVRDVNSMPLMNGSGTENARDNNYLLHFNNSHSLSI